VRPQRRGARAAARGARYGRRCDYGAAGFFFVSAAVCFGAVSLFIIIFWCVPGECEKKSERKEGRGQRFVMLLVATARERRGEARRGFACSGTRAPRPPGLLLVPTSKHFYGGLQHG
jgi:hypothetical protein